MSKKIIPIFLILPLSLIFLFENKSALSNKPRLVNISKGWTENSINTVIFRHNSVVSYNNHQYVAFYDEQGNVTLAKRNLDSTNWQIKKTQYTGNIKDAHNSISIMIDGEGYLHMSWNQHGNPLHYCKSEHREELVLTNEIKMTGYKEQSVTYPEFYRMPDGNLIFMYRDGKSGNGNLILNYYDTKTRTWSTKQKNLIDGEGKRNAYWQANVGVNGTIHISWVWRESRDVTTNHDICYAKSTDNGKSWLKSNNEKYKLPITLENAEYILRIPGGSELINQTSICTDKKEYPFIASYWTTKGTNIPQYQLVFYDGTRWQTKQISKRTIPFSLSGGGTRKIPISRPLILINKNNTIYLIFRDIERNNFASVAVCNDIKKNNWDVKNLTAFPVGMWEPTYDTELWRTSNKLNLFIQRVGQGNAETTEDVLPSMISILEWNWIMETNH